MTDKLTIRRRKNRNGQTTVAPFINGYNVWDLPPKLWVPDVQRAILHAYEMGRVDALNRIYRAIPTVVVEPTEWEEEESA